MNKMATKAINRKKLKTPPAAKPVDGFRSMFLEWPFTKIAQTIPLCEQNGHQDYKQKKLKTTSPAEPVEEFLAHLSTKCSW